MSIRIQTVSLASIILAAGLSVSCDDTAALAARDRASLADAMQTLRLAEAGSAEQDNDAYRREKLEEAAGQLQALTATADPVASTEARVLLAEVKVTQARDQVQQASAAFAEVGRNSRALFDQLAAIERINALIVARGGDGGSTLNALGEGGTVISESRAAAGAKLQELASQRESAILDAEKYNSAAASDFTQATEFEKQAFVASNDAAKQEAYTKAYKSQLAGQAAQKQAQDAQTRADSLALQVAALENEIALWNKMATQVDGMIERVRTEGAAAASDVSSATSNKSLAVTNMKQGYDEIAAVYENEVKSRLDEAVANTQQALELLDGAQRSASSSQRNALAFDRLKTQTALTQALTRQARYDQDFADIVRAISQNPAVSGTSAAQAASSQATRLSDSAKEATERAQKAIAEGLQLAEPLVGETQAGQAAGDLSQALRTYGTQLN